MPALWKQIFQAEREILANGTLKKGELFHTVESLAAKHQVSNITSRRVLSELTREGLLKSVPRVGSLVAKSFKTPKIYLLSPVETQQFGANAVLSEVMKGIFEQSRDEKLDVIPVTEDFFKHPVKEECFLIYLYGGNYTSPEVLEQYSSDKLRMICVRSAIPTEQAISITSNSPLLTELMMTHLFEQGYRRIAYFGPVEAPWFPPRLEGYLKAHTTLGLPLDMSLIVQTDSVFEVPERYFERLLAKQPWPDAVLCPGTPLAYQFLAYCNRKKIKVPEQIGVAGIGGSVTPYADWNLTTISLQEVEMGRAAIRLIRRMVDQEEWKKQWIPIAPILTPGTTTRKLN